MVTLTAITILIQDAPTTVSVNTSDSSGKIISQNVRTFFFFILPNMIVVLWTDYTMKSIRHVK